MESELAKAAGAHPSGDGLRRAGGGAGEESWRDVVRIGAVEGLGALRDARAIPLLALTTPSVGPRRGGRRWGRWR
ncbi:MAG: hypothetical protein IPF99_27030, partial [Deltaproteobacteria bacterium]|nr:hypothetical protein [Deltaproteobacteria bacterium]